MLLSFMLSMFNSHNNFMHIIIGEKRHKVHKAYKITGSKLRLRDRNFGTASGLL